MVQTQVKAPAEPKPGAYQLQGRVIVRFPGDGWAARWIVENPSDPDGYDWLPWDVVWARLGGPEEKAIPLVPAVSTGDGG